MAEFDRIVLVSIGEAAAPMCNYFVQILQSQLIGEQRLEGVTVGSALLDSLPPQIHSIQGNHPLPDLGSRKAAAEIMALLRTLDKRSLVLFLISGGGSAMVEQPLDPCVSVEETAEFYRGLLHSGLNIVEMNALRKHFSAVKGGRMAEAAGAATQCTVLVSDVPRDALYMVSSGPTLPDPSTRDECAELIRSRKLDKLLPRAATEYFLNGNCKETPKETSPAFERASWICLLSNEQLLKNAAMLAKQLGYTVVIDSSCDDWPYQEAAEYLLKKCTISRSNMNVYVCFLVEKLQWRLAGVPVLEGETNTLLSVARPCSAGISMSNELAFSARDLMVLMAIALQLVL